MKLITQILYYSSIIIGTIALAILALFDVGGKWPEILIWIVIIGTTIFTICTQIKRRSKSGEPVDDERTLKIMSKSMQASWMIIYFMLLIMILLDIKGIVLINYRTISIIALLMSSIVQVTRPLYDKNKI